MPADSLENYSEEQRASMARAMHTLLNNSEVSRDTKRLLKKVDPKLQFADLDVDDRIEQFKTEQAEKDRARDEADRVRRANESYEQIRGKVTARGFAVEEVEKVMKDKGIANYDTAMEYIDAQRQLAPSTPDSLMTMDMPSNMNDMNKMGLKKFRLNEGAKALSEVIQGRKRA